MRTNESQKFPYGYCELSYEDARENLEFYIKNYGPTVVKLGIIYLILTTNAIQAVKLISATAVTIQPSRVFISIVIGASCIVRSSPPFSLLARTACIGGMWMKSTL